MQNVIFISAHSGTSKKGNAYSIVRLSDGRDSFTVSKNPNVDISGLHEGDECKAEFHVSKGFGEGTIKATLVSLE